MVNLKTETGKNYYWDKEKNDWVFLDWRDSNDIVFLKEKAKKEGYTEEQLNELLKQKSLIK
jgi:hypothetical protein